jgi:hypothetical protein
MQSAHNGYYKGSIPFGLNKFMKNEKAALIKLYCVYFVPYNMTLAQ